MADILAQHVPDIVEVTQPHLGRLKFSQIYQDLVSYEIMGRWLKRDKLKFGGGRSVHRNLMIRASERSAEHVGYTAEDRVRIPSLMRTLQLNWVHCQTQWGLIYQTDILMNSDRQLIVEVLKPRRAKAVVDMAEELEEKGWSSPAANDEVNPAGVTYWIVSSATEGFNGGAPSGHTLVANINPAVDTRFKNWTGTYSTIGKGQNGLVHKLRKAFRRTGFKSPVGTDEYRGSKGANYRLYTDEPTLTELELTTEGQHENLGTDVARMDGKTVIHNNPVLWVPQLDNSSLQNPMYFIDHNSFHPICLSGDFLRESRMREAPYQHNLFHSFVDLTYQFLCDDRRRNGVLYKV